MGSFLGYLATMDIHNATIGDDDKKKKSCFLHPAANSIVMANRDLESLYDYTYEDQDDDDEPYLYSPGAAYEEVVVPVDQLSVVSEEASIPHRLEDTEYPITQNVPFYADTTNKQAYTWKVPNARERRTETNEEAATKVPFYSETTHRSQYQPIDASVARTRLSRKPSALPTSNVPIDTQTTYRNLFQELEIGKRQKLIQTCPAERLIHQTALLRKSRRENGHFFLSSDLLNMSKSLKATVRPTPSLKEPAQK